MDQPECMGTESSDADEQVDPEYTKITAQGLLELEAQRQAEEERRKASAPPPDTRTPEEKAEHLRKFADGAFLQGAMRTFEGPIFNVQTFTAYLDDFQKRLGVSSDPVEQMMARQLAQAHFAIGRLHVRASASRDTGEAATSLAAAARLMGEFRKTSLALQTYREASKKQTEASCLSARHKKKRPAAAVDGKCARKERMPVDTELGSNHSPHNRLSEYFHAPEPALS